MNSKWCKNVFLMGSALVLLFFGASQVGASTITVTQESFGLKASAEFEIDGDDLKIKLSNLAADDQNLGGWDVAGRTLTGLFFDITGGAALSTVSATVAPGAIIQPAKCDLVICDGTTTNVGGEWLFDSNGDTPLGNFGIASAGYLGLSGNSFFGGPDLDSPLSVDGINFGIISSVDATFLPNGGLEKEPLIDGMVTFVLSGAAGLDTANIGNVSFQYGTNLGEANIPNNPIPEPSTMILLGSGMFGLVAFRRWRQR